MTDEPSKDALEAAWAVIRQWEATGAVEEIEPLAAFIALALDKAREAEREAIAGIVEQYGLSFRGDMTIRDLVDLIRSRK